MTLYNFILLIHVMSAILGMGPGFAMIYVITKAENLSELKNAYLVRQRLHAFVMIGGVLLVVSGITMGIMRPYLFHKVWYVTSIIFLVLPCFLGLLF